MALLEVNNLSVSYGAIQAVKRIDFSVNEGEIVSLIGSNGAGKTTTLQAVSGLIKVDTGTISFDGNNLLTTPAHKIVSMGLAHVPEGRRIFAGMTVKENLEMGSYTRKDSAQIRSDYEKVLSLLPRLEERLTQTAGTLSGGEQQMLAIGRAMMSHPKMLLLDEPSMGLSPLLVQEIFSIISGLNETGMTILLVEQNAKMALQISNRAYVLETGKIVMEGDAKILSDNDEVRKAYLGG